MPATAAAAMAAVAVITGGASGGGSGGYRGRYNHVLGGSGGSADGSHVGYSMGGSAPGSANNSPPYADGPTSAVEPSEAGDEASLLVEMESEAAELKRWLSSARASHGVGGSYCSPTAVASW